MKNLLSMTATIAILTVMAAAAPRLVVSTPAWVPESQIDVVFDSPITAIPELGKSEENHWLDIQPPLAGKLLWKAQNIVQFIPERAPTIGTTYNFSLLKGHQALDQTTLSAGKFATLASEPFQITAANPGNRWPFSTPPATGPWLIAFNDSVDPATALPFVWFASGSGQQVAAKLEHPTVERAGSLAASYKPWASRFPNHKNPEAMSENSVSNILVATPASPLPVGVGWKIHFQMGLPNLSANAGLVEDRDYEIGEVEPFKVTEIKSRIVADRPREVVILLNQAAPETLPANFLETCIEISPLPANLQAKSDERQIILSGDFSSADKYKVRFKPPFTSKFGIDLNDSLSEEIRFEHLKPRVGFPSEDVGQLAKGNRQYRLLTLNLESVRIRVKKLAGQDLIRAFQGYRHFTGNGPDNEQITPKAPIPYPLVVGPTLLDREFSLGNPVDTTKIVTLEWDQLLPKDLRYGELFIEASGKNHPDCDTGIRPTTQAIIQLTDIGLAWKITDKDATIYAFSCDTGAPLPGVKLQLYGEEATEIQSTTTDTSGLAVLPRSALARHLQATLGTDSYVSAFDSTLETVGLWHFPIRYSWRPPAETARKAFLFTDRSLYRPGETVRMKGIVRTQRGNAIEPVNHGAARIVITDPTEKEIHTHPVTLSNSGSFDFTYSLPPGKTGTHWICLKFPEELARAETLGEDSWAEREAINESARFELPLQVEEFRRNAFEVEQAFSPTAPAATSISSELTANYYQGQPVAAGKVKYFSRITAQNPYPERFRDFLFGNHRTDDSNYWFHYFGYRPDDADVSNNQTFQVQGETLLSPDGKATILTAIPQAEFPTAREVTLASEVTDANNQTLTSTVTATVHPASVYVGVSRNDKLIRVGEPVALKLVATDTRGEPFTGAVKVTATLSREVNSSVKSRTESGATTTRNHVAEETISTAELNLEPAASAAQGTSFTVIPRSNGRHFLSLRGVDPDGRPFATVTHFDVYGSDEFPWLYEDGLRVKLVAEKKSYKPGETARVLVLSPIEGTALVTIEREKVLRSFFVQIKADQPVIEIPLTEADAPNAYVSILIVKGAKESTRTYKEPQLRLGYCELVVENLRDKLAVNLQTPSLSCRPGEEITVTGSVLRSNGTPAAGAEVTLYAEDEGTLAVMGYETPKPMDYFYTPRILSVESGISFENFVSEDPEKQSFSNKGFFIGGGGDLGKLADLMRKNFDPCAAWVPALITNNSGKFTHTFKFPDTLTQYRLIAVAHQDAARFGHAESSIVVKKDLMLEPKTPRFANQGDILNTQVLVQNASKFTGTWEIAFSTGSGPETSGIAALGPSTEQLTLAPGASSTLVFPVRADQTGEAVLTWRATPISLNGADLTVALKRDLSDSVEARFPIHYPMPLLRQTKLVNLDKPNVKRDLLKQLDPRLLSGSGGIDLEFSQSPLIEAAGSIDFLLHYPYGCVEQTTSSLIPWLCVEELRQVIPNFSKIPDSKIAAAIQAGADRLLSMQLPDGSFTYWPGGTESAPWTTAYAGIGLIMAAEKGANIPPSAVESLVKNLAESLRGIANAKSASALENHSRALFALALAGSPQPAYQNLLIDRLAELTPSARSLLAAAIATQDRKNPANLATAKSVLTSTFPCKLDKDDWMPWSADEAYRLIAWILVEPDGQEPTKALDRMLNERNPYGHWRTTWVNGWSLMAMAAYSKNQAPGAEIIALTCDTNFGTETLSLTREQPATTRSYKITPDLKLVLTSDHPAFVRLRVAAKPQIVPSQPLAMNGLSIDRTYERVLADGSSSILTEPKPGDLIRVSLRVTLPKDGTRYLIVEDALPSIFETVNSDFKSQRAAAETSADGNDWQISHSELRSERASFFLDEIARKGTYTVSYLARCTLAGHALAPPAKVESMYDPENFALSASRDFSSK